MALNTRAQAAVRAAGRRARRAGDVEITPLHLVGALLDEQAGDPSRTAADSDRSPRMGTALSGVLRAAAAAAARAGASEVSPDEVLAAALAAAAGTTTEQQATAAESELQSWPIDDGPMAERVLALLARRRPPLVVLAGDRSLLPERVVAGLASRLHTGAVPGPLVGAHLEVLAEGAPLQSLGHRVRARLQALQSRGGPGVAFVPAIATVAAAPGGLDALVAAHTQGVGLVASGDAEDMAALRRLPALRPLLQAVEIEEPTPDEALVILRDQTPRLERHHGVAVAPGTAEAAVRLSIRHDQQRALPGKALDLLEDACAAAAIRQSATVTAADVAAAVGIGRTLPGGLFDAGPGDVSGLVGRLHERIVGQERAIAAVAGAIQRAETGVGDPDRPLGSFLFLGPTGVGKTELARSLVAALFADATALIRLDMGEYQESHAVARLVGAPPGYVGYEHGGHLTEPLRRRPYSVVLLDEIEKAHPDVLNTLLAVLDEGRLTDGYGRNVDARHCVLIMTSNLGSRVILDPTLTQDDIDRRVRDAVVEHFPPEFHSRVDEVVVFSRLGDQEVAAIVALHLGRLLQRLSARDLHVVVGADVRSWLAAQVQGSPHGARPLRAAVRRHVEDVVAQAVLDGRLQPGGALHLALRDGAVVGEPG